MANKSTISACMCSHHFNFTLSILSFSNNLLTILKDYFLSILVESIFATSLE